MTTPPFYNGDNMKIALGMITRNERSILEKTLLHKALDFDFKIAVDFYSSDYTVELLGSFGVHVVSQEWKGNYAQGRNQLIQVAEEAGFDYLFMLDADEAMSKEGIELCKKMAEKHDVLTLPRFEFVQDFQHYDSALYPDWQCRFFKLNKGYHFKNKVHEMLHNKSGDPLIHSRMAHKVLKAPIYHYGRCKPREVLALKYINYDRVQRGLEPLTELPHDVDPSTFKLWERCEPFVENHPLERTNA